MNFIQWFLVAGYVEQFTVISAVAAVLALIVGFFARTAKSKISGDHGSVVGNSIKNSTITINAPPKETNASSDKA